MLEGRLETVDTPEPTKNLLDLKSLTGQDDLPLYREKLENASRELTPANLEAIRDEALRCCTGARLIVGDFRWEAQREALARILDVIVSEPGAFAYATNELRGFFFSQLLVKYDALLKSRS